MVLPKARVGAAMVPASRAVNVRRSTMRKPPTNCCYEKAHSKRPKSARSKSPSSDQRCIDAGRAARAVCDALHKNRDRAAGRSSMRIRVSLTIFKQLAGEIGGGDFLERKVG